MPGPARARAVLLRGLVHRRPCRRRHPAPGRPRAGTGELAGATYREYAADVWRTPAAALSILESKRGRPPWEAAPAPAPPVPNGPVNLPLTLDSTSPGHVMVFRSADAAGLWTQANEAPGPFILVTGWQQARQAPLERITVLTADDVTQAEAVPRPSTPVAHQDPPARQARRPGLLSRIANSVFGAARRPRRRSAARRSLTTCA